MLCKVLSSGSPLASPSGGVGCRKGVYDRITLPADKTIHKSEMVEMISEVSNKMVALAFALAFVSAVVEVGSQS